LAGSEFAADIYTLNIFSAPLEVSQGVVGPQFAHSFQPSICVTKLCIQQAEVM
jgi:hypothetical protein